MAKKYSLIRLSDNQKRVLVRVSQAPTGLLGATEAGRDDKLATSRDMLVKLGLLDYDGGEATVNDEGMEVMQDEGLVDESGELTEEGQKWLGDESGEKSGGLMKDINTAAGPAGDTLSPPMPGEMPPSQSGQPTAGLAPV